MDYANYITNNINKVFITGKSVFISQVALLVYMVHCGCYIPASRCEMKLLHNIHALLNQFNHLSYTMSQFTVDCSTVSYMLHNCTPHSLLIIDEYGSSTTAYDSIALLASIIRYYDTQSNRSPLLLITTHVHELFGIQLIRQTLNTKIFTMSYHQQNNTSTNQSVNSTRNVKTEFPHESTSSQPSTILQLYQISMWCSDIHIQCVG